MDGSRQAGGGAGVPGLLKAGIFDQPLFENVMPDEEELNRRTADDATAIQVLLSSDRY